jgi:hypothetical protein
MQRVYAVSRSVFQTERRVSVHRFFERLIVFLSNRLVPEPHLIYQKMWSTLRLLVARRGKRIFAAVRLVLYAIFTAPAYASPDIADIAR